MRKLRIIKDSLAPLYIYNTPRRLIKIIMWVVFIGVEFMFFANESWNQHTAGGNGIMAILFGVLGGTYAVIASVNWAPWWRDREDYKEKMRRKKEKQNDR